MPGSDVRCLVDDLGTTWIVRYASDHALVASPADGSSNIERLGAAPGGFDATLDSEGRPWVVWSDRPEDGSCVVYARTYRDGVWGPRLQVSTGEDDESVWPLVRADEYGNVWIFWLRPRIHEAWMCRMGPRSGQETLVATGLPDGTTLLDASTRKGVLSVLLLGEQYMVFVGTENEGFGPPVWLLIDASS